MTQYSLIQLSRNSDVQGFDCGEDELNDFLQNDALENQEAWLSVTHLLYSGENLLGFFTVTTDTLHKERIDNADLVDGYPYARYPAIKLARLAVDKRFQRQGIGTELMLHFFTTALKIVQEGGGRYITVDAKKSAMGFYEAFGFRKVTSKKTADFPPMYLDFYMLNQVSEEGRPL